MLVTTSTETNPVPKNPGNEVVRKQKYKRHNLQFDVLKDKECCNLNREETGEEIFMMRLVMTLTDVADSIEKKKIIFAISDWFMVSYS